MKKLFNNTLFLGFLFALIILASTCDAQPNTRTRQIRFATGVSTAADTAETAENAGRIWYDFTTQKYRANVNGSNTDLISSGSAYTAGGGLTLTGNQFKLGGPMANGVATINNTAGQDASVEFLVDDGLSGAYLFHTGSNSYTFEGIGQELLSTQGGLYFTGLTFNPNGMLLGMVAYADDTGPKFEFISNGIINVIRIKNIPTSSAACGTDGSGTLYNDAGTLKICP